MALEALGGEEKWSRLLERSTDIDTIFTVLPTSSYSPAFAGFEATTASGDDRRWWDYVTADSLAQGVREICGSLTTATTTRRWLTPSRIRVWLLFSIDQYPSNASLDLRSLPVVRVAPTPLNQEQEGVAAQYNALRWMDPTKWQSAAAPNHLHFVHGFGLAAPELLGVAYEVELRGLSVAQQPVAEEGGGGGVARFGSDVRGYLSLPLRTARPSRATA